MSNMENVKVALRVRPLVPSELARGCQVAVEKRGDENQVSVNNGNDFTFNYVFDGHDTQEHVYNVSVAGMLDKLFDGFNATIFAYGQTGSGKTHTMGTAFNGSLNANVGVIPRAMHDIFERTKKLSDKFDFVLKCSFMELYQEQLYDLLSDESKEKCIINMREDRNGIVLADLTEKEVHSAIETTDCLTKGSKARAVASIDMNQSSSRSHAIFTLTLQATKKDEAQTVTSTKFHLVDLAGSERSKKTGATGNRLKEGIKINQGLLALGNVMSALGDGKDGAHVSYRDSKLTRLLQNSLGGNSVTLMIACLSPADYNIPETLSTLHYADRARKIKNKPVVNQDPHTVEINRLKGIIQQLRLELLSKDNTKPSSLPNDVENIGSIAAPLVNSSMFLITSSENQNAKYQELLEKFQNLQQQRQMCLQDVATHKARAHIAETALENIKQKAKEVKGFVNELLQMKKGEFDEKKLFDAIGHISKLIDGFGEEHFHAETTIMDHKLCSSLISSVNLADCNDFDDNTSKENIKQIEFEEQLNRINQEFNLNEELQATITSYFSKDTALDVKIEKKFHEFKQKLEAEKSEFLKKLHQVNNKNASAKLAEERRIRLQTLEKETSEMKRKSIQQDKLLKIREKDTEKLRNLSKEIQSLKEIKVKLMKAVRSDAEDLRRLKLMHEKDIMHLKNKNRNLQKEIASKNAFYNIQRNVLKRKCEEAVAINKRLKDALEMLKTAQTQRQKMQSLKDAMAASVKIEQIIAGFERELEKSMRRVTKATACNVFSTSSQLGGETETRNAQVFDIQQNIYANRINTLIVLPGNTDNSKTDVSDMLKNLLKTLAEI